MTLYEGFFAGIFHLNVFLNTPRTSVTMVTEVDKYKFPGLLSFVLHFKCMLNETGDLTRDKAICALNEQ